MEIWPMPCDRSRRCRSAGLPDRASPAGFSVSAIAFDPGSRVGLSQPHLVALQTGEAVTGVIIGEMAQVILAVRLMLAVQHGDMGRDIALKQPCEKRACAIGFVGRQSIRPERMTLCSARQHLLCRDDLLAQPVRDTQRFRATLTT